MASFHAGRRRIEELRALVACLTNAGDCSFFLAHLVQQKIRDDLPKPLIFERKLVQDTPHVIHPWRAGRRPVLKFTTLWVGGIGLTQGSFPPTMKGHDAHPERFANLHLGITRSSKLIRSSEFQQNLLVRVLLHHLPSQIGSGN
ncbi:hypothetical protein [Bradyrhizobium sp. Ai1a-2]|uniref:hypothetical protein n=1 Tax=Bradyrhizobium sp. Ai1a-2 TaxID=196490 RepID=UPI001FCBBF5E|nr:hypothetical protein [Bradyrhizobium sp. Ai1a-2]